MKRKSALALLFCATVMVPVSVWAASVYVKSAKAKILQSPRFDAPLVAEVERGRELGLLDKGDRWIKVRTDGKDGWLPELVVSEEPPKGRQSVLETGGEDLTGKARRRASAIATAGASRGLTSEGVKAMSTSENGKGDWAALAKVDAFRIDRDEALKFISVGQSGGKGVR